MPIPYRLIRSSRHTLALQISSNGELIVRAPMRMPVISIESFLVAKREWIEEKMKYIQSTAPRIQHTESEIQEMKKKLREYIIPRVQELWEGKGLPQVTSIKITKSERRWGSCSARNGLCFSYRLAEYLPIEGTHTNTGENIKKNSDVYLPSVDVCSYIDAIIIHELAHLQEKHHQKSFWNLVYTMMPEYESVMQYRKNMDSKRSILNT